jgi:small-conductance mechanosensitive channel
MEWQRLVGFAHSDPALHAGIAALVGLVVALLIELVLTPLALALTRRTRGDLDDRLVGLLARPVAVSVAALGLWTGIAGLPLPAPLPYVSKGLLASFCAAYGTWVLLQAGDLLLRRLSQVGPKPGLLQPRTLPFFSFALKTFLIGLGVYALFLAWDVDVTAWLASAGIIGIAVGFAAKDTLANLFAGLSILADAPYKLGDFLVLEGGVRGRVTEIGMRSTRLLTRDDVEVIIPNSEMAMMRIVNESGGPFEGERVSAVVSVAYGSDVDHVRDVLLACAAACADVVVDEPHITPRVRVRELGDSGLTLHVLVWIRLPELQGKVLDELNTLIYQRLRAEGIEIPYAKHDIYVHASPAAAPSEPTKAAPSGNGPPYPGSA